MSAFAETCVSKELNKKTVLRIIIMLYLRILSDADYTFLLLKNILNEGVFNSFICLLDVLLEKEGGQIQEGNKHDLESI